MLLVGCSQPRGDWSWFHESDQWKRNVEFSQWLDAWIEDGCPDLYPEPVCDWEEELPELYL